MWETAKKTFNQTEWVYDCPWWQRALKDFSQRVFANLRDSPGVASRWSQVGVFANLSGPARNPRTPLYYANTAKLFNKYNHSIDANTGGFAKYTTKLIIFAIYGESMSFLGPTMTLKSKFTTTSMWQISPWKSFSKIVSVFPLVPFCQTHFFTIFQGWKVFMGSWVEKRDFRCESSFHHLLTTTKWIWELRLQTIEKEIWISYRN